MQINGFNKTTLLDYPRHLAATIFIGGCNMRCPFCHNASLVSRAGSQPVIPEEEVLTYLAKRKSILEGVCITGGEPTLYPELPELIKKIKALGFKIKLDTNGTNPDLIKSLVNDRLIDYIAKDIKNSREKYGMTSGKNDLPMQKIEESASYLLASPVDYEFRTTVVREFHEEEDMVSIARWLAGAKAYFLQCYKDSGDIIMPGLSAPSKDTLLHYADMIKPYIQNVKLRGID
jgi:pyruvate formate lyase activating enzyme